GTFAAGFHALRSLHVRGAFALRAALASIAPLESTGPPLAGRLRTACPPPAASVCGRGAG
ncbi:MAG: hypothetical protein ACO3NZ_07280, partial [Pirellulales bacterium]